MKEALRRVAPRALVSLLIAAGFFWALRRGGLPFAPGEAGWAKMKWWAIPAFVALTGAATVLRTWRWVYLLRPVAPEVNAWRVFGAGLAGYAAVFFAPLRLGEIARPYVVSRDQPVTFMQAVATVAAERIVDGLVMVGLTAIAFAISTPLSPLPSKLGDLPIPVLLVPHSIWTATFVFASAFAAMAAFYFARDTARRAFHVAVDWISPRLADKGAELVSRMAESFGFLPSWERAAPFMRNTFLYWGVNGLAYFALLRGVGLPCTVPQAFVAMGVVGLGSLLPAGPGFFGAYQVATYTALALYNPEAAVLTSGAVAVFGSYLTHIGLNAVGGGTGLLILSRGTPTRVAVLRASSQSQDA